jgi:Domain of unknown function (DUF4157)
MFAPPVAKTQTKAAASLTGKLAPKRSTIVARPVGGSAVGQMDILQRRIGNQATLRLLAQRAPSQAGDQPNDAPSHDIERMHDSLSWDFGKIPLFPSDRTVRPQPSSPLASTPLVETKLVVGRINDSLEHEADRVADQLMRMPEREVSIAPAALQLNQTCAVGEVPCIVHEVLRSPGQPLEARVRRIFEPRFRADFSQVRVHTDPTAAESAHAIDALAYTVGPHIVFREGQFTPGRNAGRRLLTHELAHVAQQSASIGAIGLRSSTAPQLLIQRQPATNAPKAPGKSQAAPALDDPRKHPRYIDNIFESVSFHLLNGAFSFHWTEGGKPKVIGIPLSSVLQNESVTPIMLFDVKPDFAAAVDEALAWFLDGELACAFYHGPEEVIMPTIFSAESTPQFHALWPALRKDVGETVEDIQEGLATLGNAINPIPGTTLDVHGNVHLSSNPLDWLALLHLRKIHVATHEGAPHPPRRRLPAGKTTTRSFVSIGIPYHVTGLEADFKAARGICVYVLKDADGAVLYVGKGDFFGDRLREHIGDTRNRQWEYWGPEVSQIELHGTELSEIQALAQEEDLIEQYKRAGEPLHNRDTRSYSAKFGDVPRARNLPKGVQVRRFDVSFDLP